MQKYSKKNVSFEQRDIYNFKKTLGDFEGLFGGFIWSHIRKEELNNFLMTVLNQVEEGAEILFLDNKYVTVSSTPISRTDKFGNTFQIRKLKSGE